MPVARRDLEFCKTEDAPIGPLALSLSRKPDLSQILTRPPRSTKKEPTPSRTSEERSEDSVIAEVKQMARCITGCRKPLSHLASIQNHAFHRAIARCF